jgi:hypothetical protein
MGRTGQYWDGHNGAGYRYYLSSALLQGLAERAGSMSRVPAVEIETLVVSSTREHLKMPGFNPDIRVLFAFPVMCQIDGLPVPGAAPFLSR